MNQNCTSTNRKCVLQELQDVGRKIMLHPTDTPKLDEFITRIIAGNTLRVFHRIDQTQKGPKEIIQIFLNESKEALINDLSNCNSIEALDSLSEKLEKCLKEKLAENVQESVLSSYNSVRKLIDLILEHVVLISEELNDQRQKLIHFLRVPLDSYILNSTCLFSFSEREVLKLEANGLGFLSVKNEEQYYAIQKHLRCVAESNQIDHPIYFDILWRNRIEFKYNILH